MMRLRIEHATGFRYPGDVGASYNEARMLPSSTDAQFVLSSQLDIDPSTSVNYYADYFGTRVAAFDVLAGHSALDITARSLVELVADESSLSPEDQIYNAELEALVQRWLDALPPKHRFVVVHRYGLRGILPQTLEDLSDEMGLTRERVRQIQLEALGQLRRIIKRRGVSKDVLL